MPRPENSQLTTRELCEALDVERRAVIAWKKAGLVPAGQRRGRGRPADLWDIDEVRRWVAQNIRGGSRTVAIAVIDDPPDTTGDIPDVPLHTLSADEITSMRDRLSKEEQAIHAKMLVAMTKDDPASYLSWHKAWQDTCKIRTAVAERLPGIMKARGRFVDIHDISPIITEASTAFANSLDRVGTSVAEQCVGRTAPEIVVVIDREIADQRSLLVAELKEIIAKFDA